MPSTFSVVIRIRKIRAFNEEILPFTAFAMITNKVYCFLFLCQTLVKKQIPSTQFCNLSVQTIPEQMKSNRKIVTKLYLPPQKFLRRLIIYKLIDHEFCDKIL